ncbi:MAG: iron ABC transporter permease [Methanomassiliicoccaceae archaeon]|nr:iron ABC transporter permease [Methanomassiliicoccaceae archaeon]
MPSGESQIESIFRRNNKRKAVVISASVLILFITILVAISIGNVSMSLGEVIDVLFFGRTYVDGANGQINAHNVVFNLRLPRVLCAAFIGAALAIAGAAMQGLFRNPMASPSVIGISNGAAFGACVSMVLGFSLVSGAFAIPAMSFVFAFITLFLVYFMARTKLGVPVTMLLLSGIAIGAFFSGLVSLLQYIAPEQQLGGVVFWLMGSIASCGWNELKIIILPIIIGSMILIILSRDLNLLSLGDDQAKNLGVNVERTRIMILCATALVVAGAVSVSGVIGFVGLIVPHIFRMLLGPDHRLLLPASLAGGAIFLVIIDTISRMIVTGGLPVGIITALLGAPFFLYILRTRKKEVWG